MKFKNLLLPYIILLFVGCKKEQSEDIPKKTEPVKGDYWDYFAGSYYVADGPNSYTIEILKLDSAGKKGFKIKNFANMFPELVNWPVYEGPHPADFFDLGFYRPAYDKNGKRWFLANNGDNPFTDEKENTLIDNKIIFEFNLANSLYYKEDSVKEQAAFHKHRAIKN